MTNVPPRSSRHDAASRAREAGWFQPETHEVAALIARAAEHPLGTEFIKNGALDAVASTFRVHAFVVDAARETLLVPALDVPRVGAPNTQL